MAFIHKILKGGGDEFLPFALAQERKLRATGLTYASQNFAVDGVTIKVRLEGEHSFIEIEGSGGGYVVLPHSDAHPLGVTSDPQGKATDTKAVVRNLTKKNTGGVDSVAFSARENSSVLAGSFDWIGGKADRPIIVTAELSCDRYAWAVPVTPTDTYFFAGKKYAIKDAKIVGFGVLESAQKFVYVDKVSDTEVIFRAAKLGDTAPGAQVGSYTAEAGQKLTATWIFSQDGSKAASICTKREDITTSVINLLGVQKRSKLMATFTVAAPANKITTSVAKSASQTNADVFNNNSSSFGGVAPGATLTYGSYPFFTYIQHGTQPFSTISDSGFEFSTLVGTDFKDGAEVSVTAKYRDATTGSAGGVISASRSWTTGSSPPVDWQVSDMLSLAQWRSKEETGATTTITAGAAKLTSKSGYTVSSWFDVMPIDGEGNVAGNGSGSSGSATNKKVALVGIDARWPAIASVEFSSSSSGSTLTSPAQAELVVITPGREKRQKFWDKPGAKIDSFAYDINLQRVYGVISGPVNDIPIFHGGFMATENGFKTRKPGKEYVVSVGKQFSAPLTLDVGGSQETAEISGVVEFFYDGASRTRLPAEMKEFSISAETNFAVHPIRIF